MAATMATMSILNAKCLSVPTNTPKTIPAAAPTKVNFLPYNKAPATAASASSALAAGAVLAALGACEPAVAAQQIADVAAAAAEGDSRGLALLLPIVPAVGWVLYNILQPALNQVNRMRESKGVVVAGGMGGLAALGLLSAPEATAAAEAAAAGGDNRGTLLLFVIAPAVLWVLYNILQPALNQLNRMRSD